MHNPYDHSGRYRDRPQKTLLRHLRRRLPVPDRANVEYSAFETSLPLVKAGIAGCYPAQAADDLREAGIHSPSKDALFSRLNQISSAEVLDWFNRMNSRILQKANLSPSMVALDIHKRPYYGKDHRFVIGTKRERGTNYAQAIITIERVEEPRQVLWAHPFLPLMSIADRIADGVRAIRKLQRIKLLMIDREAFRVKCLEVLHAEKVPYLIPAVKNQRVAKRIRRARKLARPIPGSDRWGYWDEFMFGGVKTRLVIEFKDETLEKCFVYVTNQRLTLTRIKKLADQYRSRWGIETSYRVRKAAKIMTNSQNFVVRLLFMFFEILLFNLWLLVCDLWVGHRPEDRYPVTYRRFRATLLLAE